MIASPAADECKPLQLRTFGERGDDDALRRAVAAFESALEEYTRDRAPLAWAMTQNNLGAVLQVLGERGDDDALRRAVAAFEAALEVFVAARADYYIEVCRNNRDGAQALLAKRKS